jgi:hypothetical protein
MPISVNSFEYLDNNQLPYYLDGITLDIDVLDVGELPLYIVNNTGIEVTIPHGVDAILITTRIRHSVDASLIFKKVTHFVDARLVRTIKYQVNAIILANEAAVYSTDASLTLRSLAACSVDAVISESRTLVSNVDAYIIPINFWIQISESIQLYSVESTIQTYTTSGTILPIEVDEEIRSISITD